VEIYWRYHHNSTIIIISSSIIIISIINIIIITIIIIKGLCYFSIYGFDVSSIYPNSGNSDDNNNYSSYRLHISTLDDRQPPISSLEIIYRNIDGSIVSQRERYHLSLDSHALTYAETDTTTFLDILDHANIGDGNVLYDLGSGNGQCVLSAALSKHRFFKCVGIEVIIFIITIQSLINNNMLLDFTRFVWNI